MRQFSVQTLALAALLMVAAIPRVVAEIEAGGAVNVEACASDPKLLGLSRIVEVDTAGGANIGGAQPGATHFLNDGEVVLTFDDGPMKSITRAVLKALSDQCTKATFFMVGQMALADPEMVKEVAEAGHTIGTHTWSHKNLRLTSLAKSEQEIESAVSTVSKAKGTPVAPLFRFPYLSASRQAEDYLKSRNIGAVWIDIDSKDYLTHDPEVVKKRILAQLAVEKKGIILMHDIHPWTAKMLPDLLAALHEKGFKIVHMVPKGTIETIASFDAMADKALAKKIAARKANPIASHSMVWTMAPAPVPGVEVDAPTPPRRSVKKVSAKPTIAEGLPDVSAQQATAVPRTARSKKAAKPKDEDPSWQLNIFSN
jgi:peptidoglycan/xylan/chitin deacetylase (PgdA/CDA1 family)